MRSPALSMQQSALRMRSAISAFLLLTLPLLPPTLQIRPATLALQLVKSVV